jgi:hypothetical protein
MKVSFGLPSFSFYSKRFDELFDFQVDDSIIDQPHGPEQDTRYMYLKMIFIFMRYSELEVEEITVDL